jgi:hypothetical protein
VSDREKARRALKKLEEVEVKRAEQRRLEWELRRSLERQAYDSSQRFVGQVRQPSSVAPRRCSECRQEFLYGDVIEDIVGDDGTIVASYHHPSCQYPRNVRGMR